MIGETRTTSFVPGGPARTGQQRCCRHSATADWASTGGSSSETNAPVVSISRWAPISEARIASSLDRARSGLVFCTSIESRTYAPSRVSSTRTAAASGQRVRTTRPGVLAPFSVTDPMSCPPVMVTGNAP